MTYSELYHIAKPYIGSASSPPCNAFSLASRLGISYKTEKQCEEDFANEISPLKRVPAVLYCCLLYTSPSPRDS